MEQNESMTKKRLIRRATIIFVAGMAGLTLFSNTIVNYSLPRVQVKNFESGIIYRQIQADGTIAAQLQHTVNFAAARTVDQVKVEVGSQVLVGDVLATLKPADGLDILELEKALENAELALDRMKETPAALTVPDRKKAVAAAQKAVSQRQKAIDEARKALDKAKADQITAYAALIDVERAAEVVLRDMETILAAKQAALGALEADPAALASDILAAQAAVTDAQNAVNAAGTALGAAQTASNKGVSSDAADAAAEALVAAKDAYTDAVTALSDARKELTAASASDVLTVKNRTRDITKAENDLLIQKKKFEQIKATQGVNVIKADYAGRISKLSLAPGGTINPGEAVAVIDAADAKYELRASLPVEQAKVLVVGDRADVMMGNMGWAQAILREMRDDKDQPGVVKQLVFDVQGEVTLGQQVSLSIYKQSRNYEMIVPNAAVRQDANGSFILAMRQKNGPLGSRYTLDRITVSVLETDSTRSAVSATLEFGVPIVTAANKPVEAGSRVLPTK